MADVVDDDVERAVVALWAADPLNQLAALFKTPPRSGRLKPPQPDLYATVNSEKGRDAERFVGGRKDYRKVTIKAYGRRADVVKGLAAVLSLFNDRTGAPGRPTLTLPSGARFLCWWPTNDGVISQDPDTKAGEDVWVGTAEGEVRSVRVS